MEAKGSAAIEVPSLLGLPVYKPLRAQRVTRGKGWQNTQI